MSFRNLILMSQLTAENPKQVAEYIDTVDTSSVEINKHISSDLEQLQQHYTILLDYVCDLEARNHEMKEERDKYKRWVQYYKNRYEKED